MHFKLDLRRCTKSPCGPNCVCIEIPQNMNYECRCESNNTNNSNNYNNNNHQSLIENQLTCI